MGLFRKNFVDLCVEHGLLDGGQVETMLNDDLIESGMLDSMGIVTVQTMIQETYGIDIPTPLFIAELRSINNVIAYLYKLV